MIFNFTDVSKRSSKPKLTDQLTYLKQNNKKISKHKYWLTIQNIFALLFASSNFSLQWLANFL